MNNRKGFTLIELLVTITIIGIIMIMTLPAIHNLQRENQKKKFDDYERAVLEAAKAYEDQYEEDLFGRSDTSTSFNIIRRIFPNSSPRIISCRIIIRS